MSCQTGLNYYQILGIPTTANDEEIHEAFRNQAKVKHPDISNDDGTAMQKLNIAYGTLINIQSRVEYDKSHEITTTHDKARTRNRRQPRTQPPTIKTIYRSHDRDVDTIHIRWSQKRSSQKVLSYELEMTQPHEKNTNLDVWTQTPKQPKHNQESITFKRFPHQPLRSFRIRAITADGPTTWSKPKPESLHIQRPIIQRH